MCRAVQKEEEIWPSGGSVVSYWSAGGVCGCKLDHLSRIQAGYVVTRDVTKYEGGVRGLGGHLSSQGTHYLSTQNFWTYIFWECFRATLVNQQRKSQDGNNETWKSGKHTVFWCSISSSDRESMLGVTWPLVAEKYRFYSALHEKHTSSCSVHERHSSRTLLP